MHTLAPDLASKKLAIIGCGKLGQTLGRLWAQAGVFVIQDILNRSVASAQEAVAFIGSGLAANSFSDLGPADVFLIGVPDDQIAYCAQQLAHSGCLRQGAVVFHCSGALPSNVMQVLKDAGAAIASVHPIKSFAAPHEAVASFAGTWCGMEGDQGALDVLQPAFTAIGARPVQIRTEDKLIYHSAAVFASNYLVTLMDVALQAYARAGIPEPVAREMMAPLVKGTVDNVLRSGTEQALTGPIARGDIGTAVRQYHAVSAWDRRFGRLYKQMGKLTAALAARQARNVSKPSS